MRSRSKGVMCMPIVALSSKHQFTIPKEIRTKLEIKPGQRFLMSDRNGSIVLTPVPDDPIEFLCGCLKDGPSLTKELLEDRAADLRHDQMLEEMFCARVYDEAEASGDEPIPFEQAIEEIERERRGPTPP